MQILNTLTVLALVVLSFALILLGGIAWLALVLVNWGMSFFVV
jgi:photosystem II PsbZ protein